MTAMPLSMLTPPLTVWLALDASWLDTQALGAALLIMVAAAVLAYVITMIWPKSYNPPLFGFLVAVAFVGGLAFAKVTGAGLAIVLVLAIAIIMAALGVTGLS